MGSETGIRKPFLHAFAIALAIAAPSCRARAARAVLPRYVAHAMGAIDGRTYTNSLEAWRMNYAKGCRLFETDLWITGDGKLVAFHGAPLEAEMDLSPGFRYDEFMRKRIYGAYSPLDADRIARLLQEKSDWKVVTDTKSDLRRSLEMLCGSLRNSKVDCTDRVIPQIYDPATDLSVVKKLGFREVIFTIYLSRIDDEEIVRVARENPLIVAVTMPPARATLEMIRWLEKAGVRSYVHTVNGKAIPAQFDRGVWGVYTDFGCPGG
jgi:glycerophosphoryl diester phosphodiesterase